MAVSKIFAKTVHPALLVVLYGCCVNVLAVDPWANTGVISAHTTDNEIQCGRLCWYRQPCVSYSYSTITTTYQGQNCVLHSVDVQGTVVLQDWKSQRVDGGMVINGCASRLCGVREVCVPAPSAQQNCLVPDFSEIPTAATTTSGPSQTTVGSKSETTVARADTTVAMLDTTVAIADTTTGSVPTTSVSETRVGSTQMTTEAKTTTEEDTTTTESLTTESTLPPATTEPLCPDPPLLQRTIVSRTYLADGAVTANYSCSVNTDVYVKGSTSVTCTNGTWPQPTILCAPTDCWYRDPTWDGVYLGTVNSRFFAGQGTLMCDRWDAPTAPFSRTGYYQTDEAFVADLTASAANNYCRLFPAYDNYYSAWCYSTDYYNANSGRWFDCDVPECSPSQGILVS